LNLDRLRMLRAIATYGSVNAAADALHVTTSAISQQMAKLEGEVDQRLLERSGRGVRLTDAGEVLVRHADRILSLVEEVEADLEARRDAVKGRLAIAAFPTAARGLVPGVLRALRAEHPDLEVVMSEIEMDVSVPMVARGDLDLAVAQDWINAPFALPEGLMKSSLLDDVGDIALPAGHPLAQRKTIRLEQLAFEPWITWARGSICHDWLMHTLRSKGIEARIAHTAAEYPTQLALVAAGLGACVIPRLGRGAVPRGVRIVRVEPVLSRHVYAVWRRDAARRPAIRATVKAMRAAASS
jgi:molybdate transport repressor ModE-like protein